MLYSHGNEKKIFQNASSFQYQIKRQKCNKLYKIKMCKRFYENKIDFSKIFQNTSSFRYQINNVFLYKEKSNQATQIIDSTRTDYLSIYYI